MMNGFGSKFKPSGSAASSPTTTASTAAITKASATPPESSKENAHNGHHPNGSSKALRRSSSSSSQQQSPADVDLRRVYTMPARGASPTPILRHSKSDSHAVQHRLDRFGFILNMDSQGHVLDAANDDISLEDHQQHVASFAEFARNERRSKKWQVMLGSWSPKHRKLRKRLRKGLPDSMRGAVWVRLGNLSKKVAEHPGLYQKLVLQSVDRMESTAAAAFAEGVSNNNVSDKEIGESKTASSPTSNTIDSGDGGNSHDNASATAVTSVSSAPKSAASSPSSSSNLGAAALAHKSFRNIQDTIERDIHRTYPRHSMFYDEKDDDDESGGGNLFGQPLCGSTREISQLIMELELGTTLPRHVHPDLVSRQTVLEGQGGQASLRRVLKAYSMYDSDIGYCQGMNFIAGMFLTLMSEEEAFWMLVTIMHDPPCRMRDLFGEGMRETHQVLFVAERLIQQFLPKLAKHMEREHLHVTMFATQWLLTQYTSSFHFDLVTRVWDCFLVDGWKVTYRVMLAILQQWQSQLLKMSFEEILAFFRELPDRISGGTTMGVALKIPLRRQHIAKLEKEWQTKNPPGSTPGANNSGASR